MKDIRCRYNKEQHVLQGNSPDTFKRCRRIATYGHVYNRKTKPPTWWILRCSEHKDRCCKELPKQFTDYNHPDVK